MECKESLTVAKTGVFVFVAIIIIIIIANYNVESDEKPIDFVESIEKMQNQTEDQIKAEQAFIKRKTKMSTFKDAFNYYHGEKGIVQNYAKAEESFLVSAEMGAPFSPHYLVEILVDKHNNLKASDRTKDHIKECYFWLLIAKCHSSLWQGSDYGGCYIGHMDRVFSHKAEFEKILTPIEIKEIQDLAGNWWEAHKTESNY